MLLLSKFDHCIEQRIPLLGNATCPGYFLGVQIMCAHFATTSHEELETCQIYGARTGNNDGQVLLFESSM